MAIRTPNLRNLCTTEDSWVSKRTYGVDPDDMNSFLNPWPYYKLSSKHKPHYRGRAQSEPLGRPVEYKRKRVRFEMEDDQEEITGVQVRRSSFN